MAAVAVAGRPLLALLVLLACAAAAPARADDIERVTEFRQDIEVARDGTVTVSETITVNAQGDFIQHGIFRDFPTIYRAAGNVHVRFDVLGATLDGHDTPFAVQALENGKRVQIGDPDAQISHGLHVFALRYVTDRQVAFLAGHDEFYWNVTGTGWDFEIVHASAALHLPAGARITATHVYTGKQGERGHAAAAGPIQDGSVAFETSAPLDPNEGLTIDVDFAKGAVAPPNSADRRRYLWRDNAGAGGALGGLALLCLYFLAVWWMVGRDPKRGTIIPLFASPRGLSPAAMRYVHRMQYDRKAFAATLIALAVKGVLTISETRHFTGPVFTLKRSGEPKTALSNTEAAVASELLGWDGEIEMTQKNHGRIAAAISQLKKTLSDEYEKTDFNANLPWFWPGLAIIAASCVAAAVLSDDLGGALLVFLWSGLFGVATGLFAYLAFNAWRTAIIGHGAHLVNIAIALFRTLVVLPFAGTLIGLTFFLNASIQPVTIAILVAEALVAILFYRLLRAPTLAGQKLRDEIDGFALFLKTTERDRLETLHPPDVTPALFEDFLPYAIALDCENQWSKKFELATAVPDGAAADHRYYVPMWYQGDAFRELGAGGFASAIGISLGSAAASASSAPGSGSGGGGGFSGGGGGGGGGGGW